MGGIPCPYCGKYAVLVDSSVIYRVSYGLMWACVDYPNCDSYVGCHPGTRQPLGRLADRELRAAKKAAHAAFDQLWKAKIRQTGCGRNRARTDGYNWLAKQLGINKESCHIGMMDIEDCRKVVNICTPYLRRKTSGTTR